MPMQLSVSVGEVRFRAYQSGDALKGFVDFQLLLKTPGGEDGLLELKDWTIREVEFEGRKSMRLMPPGKPAKEGSGRKYDNYAYVNGKGWYVIADEIVRTCLNGGASSGGGTRAPAREEAPAAAPASRPTRGGGFMGRGTPGKGLA